MILIFVLLNLLCIFITLSFIIYSVPSYLYFLYGIPSSISQILSLATTCYLLGYATQSTTGRYHGEIWNIKIAQPKRILAFRIIGILCGLVGIIFIFKYFQSILGTLFQDCLNTFTGFIEVLLTGNVSTYLLKCLLFFIRLSAIVLPFWLGFDLSTKVGLKLYPFSKSLKSLGELALFKSIDRYINETKLIYINGEKILLKTFDNNLLVFDYPIYGLSCLLRTVTAAETRRVAEFNIGLAGLYIAKKYRNDFKFSVNKALVKGKKGHPGMNITVVTPSGTYHTTIGKTPDIPDKQTFNGYTFVRKRKHFFKK